MTDSLQNITEIDKIEIARAIECDCVELNKHIYVNRKDLTILSQNIRSIYCNFDDFLLTLSIIKFEVDIIILTECRLSTNKPIPQLSNYQSYMTTRQLNQNDGVVVYVKNTLKPRVKEISLSQASCLQLDVLNNTILCIYRSPSNTNTDSFVDSLSTHLESITSQKSIVIAGDININIITKPTEQSHEQKNRTNYLNMLSLHGILPGHLLPTRDKTCLDHFMLKINKKKFSATIAILHSTITDHFTTLLVLSKQKYKQAIPKTTTLLNYEQALTHLQEKSISDLLFCNDPDYLCKLLLQSLTDTINSNTTTINIPSSKRIIKPWITTGILRCIQNRNKLQRKLRLDPDNEILKITYTRYRNYCNNLLKRLKRKYEKELLSNSIKNSKQLWKNIKSITYTNKTDNQNTELLNLKSSPSESINFINNYFANIGCKLAQQIQPETTNCPTPLSDTLTQTNSFVLLETDCDEVHRTLMNLRSNGASGWDNISTKFLKHTSIVVVPIITHLANLCFSKGIFPAPLKEALITPVHKGGDRDDISNYRPISVLTALSKIIEKLINTRLLNYLSKFNILSDSQYGFRRNMSTEDAVSALSSLITKHLDNGQKCLTVFLDLKKAFDTVSTTILLNKLEKIGIRGIALDLLKSYLSNRAQRVKIGQHISDHAAVLYGVPQGSVLGPTLFLIYINDLCDMIIPNAKVFSYADDTAVVFYGSSWHDVKHHAESGISRVADWLKFNLLTLNASKTNFICFSISKRNEPNDDFGIVIHTCKGEYGNNCNCPSIRKVTEIRYLGVVVDNRLSWYPHVEQVTARIRKLSWLFKTLRHIAPMVKANKNCPSKNLLTQVYLALVQSVLGYCIPVWGGTAKTRLIQLERAQRALLKIMHFKRLRFPTVDLYNISDVISVRKLYIVQTILKKHKSLPLNVGITPKRRKFSIADIPSTKTKFACNQYRKRSAQLYNRINKKINIHSKNKYDCKETLIKWIKPLTYEDTEALL